MGGPQSSSDTTNLELQSLQLDVKTLQANGEADRQDFLDFREHVTTNFQSVQKTLGELQISLSTFISSFPAPKQNPPNTPEAAQGSGQNATPQNQLHTPPTAGSAVLQDVNSGKEHNLDGSAKAPYRHPHYNQPRQVPPQEQRQTQVVQIPPNQVINLDQQGHEEQEQQIERGQAQREPLDNRRQFALVKPTKYNIREFDGNGTDFLDSDH